MNSNSNRMNSSLRDNQTIGLIGIGLLGAAIAERLLAAGRPVLGFDLDAERVNELASLGGTAAESAHDVFDACPIVILCLPTSEIVAECLAQPGVRLRHGQIMIDTTTGDPAETRDIGARLATQSVRYIEAKVAGSSDQLRRGDALLLVGGEPTSIEAALPILKMLSPHRFVLGPVGAASRMKLVHNLVLGLHRAVLAEGLAFAESLGLDTGEVLAVLQQSPAGSQVMRTKGPRMVQREFTPQARLSQHLKDVRLMLAEAERVGQPLSLTSLHEKLLATALAAGYGECDNSAIVEVFRRPQQSGEDL